MAVGSAFGGGIVLVYLRGLDFYRVKGRGRERRLDVRAETTSRADAFSRATDEVVLRKEEREKGKG